MADTMVRKRLAFFKPDPGNPRKSADAESLRELHDSLCQRQCVPLLAKPDGTIIDGWRRWCAANLDGKPEELDVIITDEPLTPAQIKEIQLVSALHRTDLTAYEQYVGCMAWLALNQGATVKELAANIHRDPSMLTRILSLSKCISEVQAAAADGKLGPSEWYIASQAPADCQLALLEAKLAGATRDELARLQKQKSTTGGSQAAKLNRYKITLPGGTTVTVVGQELTLDGVIDVLNQVSKAAKKARDEALDAKTFVQVMANKAKARV